MKYFLALLLLFLLVIPCFGGVVINEVMYNPDQCSDSYCEWIELFNPTNESVNLSGWKLCEKKLLAGYVNNTGEDNPPLLRNTTRVLQSGQYAIITDGYNSDKTNTSGTKVYQNFGVSNNSLALHVDASSLCDRGLSNGGDTVYLYDSAGNLIDSVTYNDSWGADGNSKTLERINPLGKSNSSSNWNESSVENGTPGKLNSVANFSLVLLPETIFANTTYNFTVLVASPENFTNANVSLRLKDSSNWTQANITAGQEKLVNLSIKTPTFDPTNYTTFLNLTISNNSKEILNSSQEIIISPRRDILVEDPKLIGEKFVNEISIFSIVLRNRGLENETNISVEFSLDGNSIKNVSDINLSASSFYVINTSHTFNSPRTYTLCANITNSIIPENQTIKENDFICKNVTVMERQITILNRPESTTFGSLNFVFIKFNTYNYSSNSTRFITYGSGRRVVVDLENGKLGTGGHLYSNCSASSSIKINTSPNSTYFITVPLLIYRNCDDYYEDGTYEIGLRICKPNGDKYKDLFFNLTIQGKNTNLCPETKIKNKNSKKTTSVSTQTQSKNLQIEILNLTKEVARNEKFKTKVKLINNFDKPISFELYSYAFKGKNCITGGWTSNKKEISLDKKEQKTVELTNKIERETEPGEYSFRVRAKINGKNIDETKTIIVKDEIVEDSAPIKEIKIEEPVPIKEVKLPELKIWNDTKLRINLSNCEGCKMVITGPNITAITSRKYRVFKNPGEYKVSVIKDSEVLINKTYVWEQKEKSGEIDRQNQTEEKSKSKLTGKFQDKNIVGSLIEALQNFYNYILDLMKNSMKS